MMRAALLFSLACATAATDPALYPGAVIDPELTKVARQAGAINKMAYTTPDPFDKVCAFYQSAGVEIPEAKLTTAQRKRAIYKLPGSVQASIAWPRPGGTNTSITLTRPVRVTRSPARK